MKFIQEVIIETEGAVEQKCRAKWWMIPTRGNGQPSLPCITHLPTRSAIITLMPCKLFLKLGAGETN